MALLLSAAPRVRASAPADATANPNVTANANAAARAPTAPAGPSPAAAPPVAAPSVPAHCSLALPAFAPLAANAMLSPDAPLDAGGEARRRAERAIRGRDFVAAEAALGGHDAPASALLRARIAIGTGNAQAAAALLQAAAADGNLSPYVALERGRLALLAGQPAEAAACLQPLSDSAHPFAAQAVLPLASALSESDPARLLHLRPSLAARLPGPGTSGQSLLAALVVAAERRLGRAERACDAEVRRFVDWPSAKETPSTPPACRPLTAGEWLGRIERLVDANRNESAREAIVALRAQAPNALTPANACRTAFFEGMVARKRRRYAEAEQALGQAVSLCQDANVVRRARYTQTKVISIQDGLRALAPIEAFAKTYGHHSMVDDVLFWAGDSLQRRGRDDEAARFYRRILALPRADDHCVEAGWRLSWMAYRKGRLGAAERQLEASAKGRCGAEPWARARAQYWLGRIAEQRRRPAKAEAHYCRALAIAPLHFYAQQSLSRLLPMLPRAKRAALSASLAAPRPAGGQHRARLGRLAAQPAVAEGRYLLSLGLEDEARVTFLRVDAALKAGATNEQALPLHQSPARQASLALSMLLTRSGAHKEARTRLLRDFAPELARMPTRQTRVLWQEAYPLAYREPLARAEQESRLPPFLLQALAREESGFDAEVVSWAEAVGLTQLLLTSGQQAGRSLTPAVSVPSVETLLEPHCNARLGGALLGLFGHRLADSWPLALAAYNGGYEVAKTWWHRFGGGELAVFAEEMTVKETRMYVQRVLQTFGIYRWLYEGDLPKLHAEANLPPAAG